MEKSDHISVTLPVLGVSGMDDICAPGVGISVPPQSRRSLRRTWNQLPRCQRNLILLGFTAICVTLLFFFPGDQIIEDNVKSLPVGGALPFRSNHDSADLGVAVGDKIIANGDGDSNDMVKRSNSMRDSLGLGNYETAAETKNEVPQFKEPNILESPHHEPVVSNVDNVAAPPESPSLDYAQDPLDDNNLNKVNIQEIDINNNNIEAPSSVEITDVRAALEAAIDDPLKIPGTHEVSIEEYLARLGSVNAAQKHHFHGATNERQAAVVAAFKHSWAGYKKYAWGHDNLKPISQSSHDWFGVGLTIVDSLDTMYIMGLEEEFAEARDWVTEFLTFKLNRDVNLFEVTIRVLGGLLSAYHLSADTVFLQKSIELGNRMLPCFLSSSGIPYSDVNLASMSAHSPQWSPDSSTSEVTTIQLEFRDLSRTTNIPIYERVTHNVNEKVHALEKQNGLVPIFINANTGTFRNYATISLGARGDSYYEYLLKQWIQTGRKDNDFLILDYMRAIDGVLTQLMRRTPRDQHVYVGELINGRDFKPKMDHLTCYLPGTLLLGHKYGMPDSHLLLAKDLLETCYQTYMKMPTQLAPEISYFAVNNNEEQDIYVKPNDAHNLLRPEFIESLYYFYALTGNRTYQDMGWTIFQAFEKHTKVANGYTSIGNVKNIFNTRLRDMMESFWLGETLKYFYLLFSDNRKEIDFDKWIFNTEAHPLPIRNN